VEVAAATGEAAAVAVAAAASIGSFLAPSQPLRKAARENGRLSAKAAVVVPIAAFVLLLHFLFEIKNFATQNDVLE
jgi:hypothetical protein